MNNKIAIVGSGLAAVSAAKVLISRGIRPTIIDSGDILDEKISKVVERMSHLDPDNWDRADVSFITSNPTIHNKKTFPQKLAFGSDFFYGKTDQYQFIESDGIMPPVSYAKGGLSVGWGASVLPPDDNDIKSWPITNKELEPYYRSVLSELPYSASDDGLSSIFPLYSKKINPLDLTSGNKEILQDLQNHGSFEGKKNILFGQSRLLVQSAKNSPLNGGCRYCGYCMSGCVYGYIYKSSQDIDKLISSGLIDYIPNTLVQSVLEKGNIVEVLTHRKDTEEINKFIFDKVLVAAGAVNSTRIVLRSKKLYNQEIRLLSTVTFIAPVFRIKKMKIDWPNANTQPGIFLEYKTDAISDNWIHVQLSTPNEMVLEKLGVNLNKRNIFQWFKKKVVEHLFVVHGNIHSDHANGYFLVLKKSTNDKQDVLHSRREQIQGTQHTLKQSVWKLFLILRKTGCYLLLPFVQNSIRSGGFHVGGSLPMMEEPLKETDTNLMGNPKGWRHIHVIDSSIFPSLPATTIGLLAMANAARIASKIQID